MSSENGSVDPEEVPKRRLFTGAEMPAIGLGTFGSDRVPAREIADAVRFAAHAGYRHFDCASIYRNEECIGRALAELRRAGMRREELWITSKVWNDRHSEVMEACRQSLCDLQLEYLDLYLVHWPFPNAHPPHCDVSARNPYAKPYIHENFMATWRQMEQLVDAGLVRHIGTSNMTEPKLKLLLKDARIWPAANEMELHPHFQQPEFFQYVRSQGIEPIAYSPVGSPARPERDRAPEDTVDVEDPVIKKIAARLGVHPAVVCVKWAVQRGQTPIPFSTNPRNILANIESTISAPLLHDEMRAIAGIDKNCRLIKGQVFLWKEGQRWEDLWDLDGRITDG